MQWNLEKRKISELLPNKKNPRRLSKAQAEELKKSIERFGLCEPIVINRDGQIIGGHQRIKTLQKLGHEDIDVYVPEQALTQKEEEELNIRLNKNSGDFDYDILANEWDIDMLLDSGFTEEELHLKPPEEKPKKYDILVSFNCRNDLLKSEQEIQEIADRFQAELKIKIK